MAGLRGAFAGCRHPPPLPGQEAPELVPASLHQPAVTESYKKSIRTHGLKVPRRQLCRRIKAGGWGFTTAAPGQSRQLVIKHIELNASSQGRGWRAKETGATGLTSYAHVPVCFTRGPGAAGSGRRSSCADSGSTPRACL